MLRNALSALWRAAETTWHSECVPKYKVHPSYYLASHLYISLQGQMALTEALEAESPSPASPIVIPSPPKMAGKQACKQGGRQASKPGRQNKAAGSQWRSEAASRGRGHGLSL